MSFHCCILNLKINNHTGECFNVNNFQFNAKLLQHNHDIIKHCVAYFAKLYSSQLIVKKLSQIITPNVRVDVYNVINISHSLINT